MTILAKQIPEDLKVSIKNKDAARTSTLRMITAAIRNMSIEKKQEELDDADIIKIIKKQAKQRQDSIESFKKGKREDLAEKEEKELQILKSYLPEELSDEIIENTVKEILSKAALSSKADFGKAMKLATTELKGQADGKAISEAVKKLLN